jgi:hypothetical protein
VVHSKSTDVLEEYAVFRALLTCYLLHTGLMLGLLFDPEAEESIFLKHG